MKLSTFDILILIALNTFGFVIFNLELAKKIRHPIHLLEFIDQGIKLAIIYPVVMFFSIPVANVTMAFSNPSLTGGLLKGLKRLFTYVILLGLAVFFAWLGCYFINQIIPISGFYLISLEFWAIAFIDRGFLMNLNIKTPNRFLDWTDFLIAINPQTYVF